MHRPAIDLARHRELRAVLRRHQTAAAKTVPVAVFRRYARRFGLLQGDQLLLESEEELTILWDFCLYTHRHRGRPFVETYLSKLPPADDPDEQLIRAAMTKVRFAVIEVERVEPGTGVVARDLARGESYFVVDEGLSQSARPGWHLAYRVLPLPDYWATTGGGFPVSEVVALSVQEARPKQSRVGRSRRKPDPPPLSAGDEFEFALVITTWAFEEGTTALIRHV